MADKDKNPNKFALIGKKIAKFFSELKAELKKVIWPDRKKLIQSTTAVLMICLFAAVFIFAVDKLLSGVLDVVGFFPETSYTSTVDTSTTTSTDVSSIETSSSVSSAS